jgi:pimeloyl-ACP methyl ester carboxylesterase
MSLLRPFPDSCTTARGTLKRSNGRDYVLDPAFVLNGGLHILGANLKSTPLVTEEFMVGSIDPGIKIFVRNKRPAGATNSILPVVLYVHGATYPASTTFDLKLDGFSWMDYIASRHYDVWLLDLRGYG